MAQTGQWVIINLDAKVSKRHGVPSQLPVPKAELEEMATAGLGHEKLQKWVRRYLAECGRDLKRQNAQLARRLETYLNKLGYWEKSEAAFNSGDVATAIKHLKTVTSLDKDDFGAKQSLASCYAASQNWDKALELFEQMRDVWEGVAEYHLAFGNACRGADRRQDAIGHFVLALEAQPDLRPAMDALAALGVLVKLYEDPLDAASLVFVRRDALVEYLESQWDGSALEARDYLLRAADHESERRFDAMLAAAKRAVLLAADSDEARLMHVRALRLMGRTGEARSTLAEYLERSPEASTFECERARCALDAGDQSACDAALDRALELDPGDTAALSLRFLAAADSELEALQEALPGLEAHVAKHDGCSGAWRALARGKARVGAEGASVEAYRRAIELSPTDDELRAELWIELARWGRFDEVLRDAEGVEEIALRDWKLRWGEAEALQGAGRSMEARAAFTAINADASLHIAIRARAKRAVEAMGRG